MKQNNLVEFLSNNIPCCKIDDKIDQIFELLRQNNFDDTGQIFVLDEERKLRGFIPIQKLLTAKSNQNSSEIMQDCCTLNIESNLQEATNHALTNNTSFVAAVDNSGIFMGIIPTQMLIKIFRKEHIEDMERIAGIRKEIDTAGEALTEAPITRVRHRLPWLIIGLIGSFLATYIMSKYEATLNKNIALAFFIPGIVYLADAIGTQTETIVIRGLSMSWTKFIVILRKEMLTGFLIGLILGLISFPAALFSGFNINISVVVCLSIMLAGTLATTIGLLLPWFIQKMGRDPAFGSGPLATIIQDILSIFVFLLLSNLIL